jgi:hypothetical protein
MIPFSPTGVLILYFLSIFRYFSDFRRSYIALFVDFLYLVVPVFTPSHRFCAFFVLKWSFFRFLGAFFGAFGLLVAFFRLMLLAFLVRFIVRENN